MKPLALAGLLLGALLLGAVAGAFWARRPVDTAIALRADSLARAIAAQQAADSARAAHERELEDSLARLDALAEQLGHTRALARARGDSLAAVIARLPALVPRPLVEAALAAKDTVIATLDAQLHAGVQAAGILLAERDSARAAARRWEGLAVAAQAQLHAAIAAGRPRFGCVGGAGGAAGLGGVAAGLGFTCGVQLRP